MNTASLPKLPDGWEYEPRIFDKNVVYIVWPGNGAVSVNFKRRTFAYGWCEPFGLAKVSGRGWKEKLVGMAVESLLKSGE